MNMKYHDFEKLNERNVPTRKSEILKAEYNQSI